ncbi:predicted protein, partial [Nematostella vectensis]
VMERTMSMNQVNEHITCKLCNGYLIDATTIIECLHTFCRSCIVKYLHENNHCPTCNVFLHHSHPMNYISADRTMQEIVFKLVPGLQEWELQRQKEFEVAMFMYRTGEQQSVYNNARKKESRTDGKIRLSISPCSSGSTTPTGEVQDYHRNDEQVAICMECYSHLLKPLQRKYLRLSSQATVQHLKKFIAKKLSLKAFTEVDILCNDEILGKDHTLKFITVTRWRFKKSPLLLHYRPSLNLY